MMLDLNATAQFRKDRKRCIKRGYDMNLLNEVIDILLIPEQLPPENKDHPLSGNWANHRECHILSDGLLIYRVKNNSLYLDRTGTHADLFEE